jgi:hypothetical protein
MHIWDKNSMFKIVMVLTSLITLKVILANPLFTTLNHAFETFPELLLSLHKYCIMNKLFKLKKENAKDTVDRPREVFNLFDKVQDTSKLVQFRSRSCKMGLGQIHRWID